jgi:hypothetical protein
MLLALRAIYATRYILSASGDSVKLPGAALVRDVTVQRRCFFGCKIHFDGLQPTVRTAPDRERLVAQRLEAVSPGNVADHASLHVVQQRCETWVLPMAKCAAWSRHYVLVSPFDRAIEGGVEFPEAEMYMVEVRRRDVAFGQLMLFQHGARFRFPAAHARGKTEPLKERTFRTVSPVAPPL